MGKRCRIIVYGDSLALSREWDGVAREETYPELLCSALRSAREEGAVLENRSHAGEPIERKFERYAKEGLRGDVLILQCGIVDCAPRPISPSLRAAIGKIPGLLRWPIVRLLHVARPWLLRLGLVWRNTSIERFEAVLSTWLARALNEGMMVCVVNIAPTNSAAERQSPGLSASISAYNACIERAVSLQPGSRLVDVHAAILKQGADANPYVNQRDGHHITRAGHRLYADLILEAALPAEQRA